MQKSLSERFPCQIDSEMRWRDPHKRTITRATGPVTSRARRDAGLLDGLALVSAQVGMGRPGARGIDPSSSRECSSRAGTTAATGPAVMPSSPHPVILSSATIPASPPMQAVIASALLRSWAALCWGDVAFLLAAAAASAGMAAWRRSGSPGWARWRELPAAAFRVAVAASPAAWRITRPSLETAPPYDGSSCPWSLCNAALYGLTRPAGVSLCFRLFVLMLSAPAHLRLVARAPLSPCPHAQAMARSIACGCTSQHRQQWRSSGLRWMMNALQHPAAQRATAAMCAVLQPCCR